jgi:transposase
MWTAQNRARYDRSKLRYPSDLTDEEWELVEPLIAPDKPGGGKRRVIMREIVNGRCRPKAAPGKMLPANLQKRGHIAAYRGGAQNLAT